MKITAHSRPWRALASSAALVASLSSGACAPDTDGFSVGPGGAAAPGGDVNPGGAASGGASLDAVRAQLANRGFQFSASSSNGARDTFDTTQTTLGLCASGFFGMQERGSFSGGGQTFTTDYLHGGRWAVSSSNGAAVLELTLLSSTQRDPPRVRRFVVSGGGGVVRFDNRAAASEPISDADCAELARRLGGAP